MLYSWGGWIIGAALLVVVALQMSRTGTESTVARMDFARRWSTAVLIGLWLVPVLSLLATGVTWVTRNRKDWTGWMAIAISMFLTSLWILT